MRMIKEYKSELLNDGITLLNEKKILFGQCGPDKRLHLSEVMQYCSDYVTELYTQRGYDRDFLVEHGYAQMVSRSSFHIYDLPKENDVITISVREEKPEGPQLMRCYEFKDSKSNQLLIVGKSLWVIVEPKTRAVVFPNRFEFLAKSDVETREECAKPGRIKFPEKLVHLSDQKIIYSMIDGNNHLTNSKYINFAIDYLPEQYQSKEITDFRLNFCKEIRKDDTMQVNAFFNNEENKILVEGKIASDGERSFECELIYK